MKIQETLDNAQYTLTGKKVFFAAKVGLCIGALVIFFLLFGIIYLGIKVNNKGENEMTRIMSEKPAFYEALGDLEKNLDTSVEPCEDFYSYACGGWIERQTIPADSDSVSVKSVNEDALDDKFREILENPANDASLGSSERKMKDFYNLCVNEFGRVQGGSKPFIKDVLGDVKGWYVTHPQTYKQSWDLTDVVSKLLLNYNVPILFAPRTAQYSGDVEQTLLYLSQNRDSRMSPRNKEQKTAFAASIREFGKLIVRDSDVQPDDDTANRIETFVSDVTYMRDTIYKTFQNRRRGSSQRRDWRERRLDIRTVDSKVTLDWLNRNQTLVDWVRVFQNYLGEHMTVSPNMEVLVNEIDRYSQISAELENNPNKDRMFNNYAVWAVLDGESDYLSWEYQSASMLFKKYFYNYRSPVVWKRCFRLLKRYFPEVLALEFLKGHSTEMVQQKVVDIASNTRDEVINNLKNAAWMDEYTKGIAIKKLQDTGIHVGLPDDIDEKTEVDEYYSMLQVNASGSLYRAMIDYNKFRAKDLASDLKKDWIKKHLSHGTMITTGFGYNTKLVHTYNMLVVFKSGYGVPSYYHEGPASINYGALGSSSAQEISNAVFSEGQYYKTKGLKNKESWWSDDSLDNFFKKADCLLDHYQDQDHGPYIIDGIVQTAKVSGDEYLDEAVGKAVSIKVAHQAFMSTKSNKQVISSLNLDDQQLFFIKVAQNSCAKLTSEVEYQNLLQGTLSNKVLVNGMVGHHQSFSDAFKCKKGSRMIPKKYCDII